MASWLIHKTNNEDGNIQIKYIEEICHKLLMCINTFKYSVYIRICIVSIVVDIYIYIYS